MCFVSHQVEGAVGIVVHRLQYVDLTAAGPWPIFPITLGALGQQPQGRPHGVALGQLRGEGEDTFQILSDYS